jgi:outer membrane receptor protein involved in Fe transport
MTSHFHTRRSLPSALAALLLTATGVTAQVTTGTIYGSITDPSGGVMPGVTVHAVSAQTGFSREAITDAQGTYRLPALPNGTYKVRTQISGFRPSEAIVEIDVSANRQLDVKLQVANQNETVTVEATAPRESGRTVTGSSERMLALPSANRQWPSLLGLVPGVSFGPHSDTSRSLQPNVYNNGFGGRSGSWMLDGADNIDNTVGGNSAPFPLEAIEQYTFTANRPEAQFSRGNSVFNIVTKSGTNQTRGSWFTLFRNDALNARTFSEKRIDAEKQDYDRMQYGGSLGGPIVMNKAHYFVAYERSQQDTKQIVNTGNTLPGDGIFDLPFRQNMFTGKLTVSPNARHYLAVRYAQDVEEQASGVTPTTAFSAWAESTNTYRSINVNHNWQTGRSSVNEFVFQYSSYLNDTPANTPGPAYTLASGAKGGANANAPQSTEEQRWQVRNDYSWNSHLLGTTHEFRTGVNWVHTPTLFVSSRGLTAGGLTLRTNDINGAVNSILLIGGNVESNIPTDLYGVYVQDNWRVTNQLTLNLGVRYDYLDGIPTQQTSQNFQIMQAAGQAGLFAGTFLQDFGKTPQNDGNNIQPRLGAVYDLRGDGRDLIRGGWGIYTDVAYTNSNVLTSTLEGGGIIFAGDCLPTSTATDYCNPALGFIFPNGMQYTAGSGISAADIGLPVISPTTGEVVSPRLQQPFTYQTNVGWSHEFVGNTTFTVDYVRVQGRNLNMRVRPNLDTDPTGATLRYLNSLGVFGIQPNNGSFRTAVSEGRSEYNALIFDVRKRLSSNFDLDTSYTLSKATSHLGTAADDLPQNITQDVLNPFSDFQLGPSTRLDSRHRITASGIVRLPYDFQTSATLVYRSALPVTTLQGVDANADGLNADHTPTAYRFTGMDNETGAATFEEAGTCETVNCSRRAPFSQVNLRVSRSFKIAGTARVEAMFELFNVFNAKNPFIPASTNLNNSQFMQPTAFSGDVGQAEQRMAQLGARLSF